MASSNRSLGGGWGEGHGARTQQATEVVAHEDRGGDVEGGPEAGVIPQRDARKEDGGRSAVARPHAPKQIGNSKEREGGALIINNTFHPSSLNWVGYSWAG